jgi:hypothetical protein
MTRIAFAALEPPRTVVMNSFGTPSGGFRRRKATEVVSKNLPSDPGEWSAARTRGNPGTSGSSVLTA